MAAEQPRDPAGEDSSDRTRPALRLIRGVAKCLAAVLLAGALTFSSRRVLTEPHPPVASEVRDDA
jgi:hypothetical protein